MTTRYERRGSVAVLQIDNPPVNGLGHATRKTLSEGHERALDDGAVKAHPPHFGFRHCSRWLFLWLALSWLIGVITNYGETG